MAAEQTQELGREGVAIIKRWLEATTFIELPWDAYHHKKETTVLHPGGHKSLDLAGHYLTGLKHAVFVECKRYSSPGRQHKEFRRLLAIAYGATQLELVNYGTSSTTEYIWVTYHPFALEHWASLETRDELVKGLEENPDVFDAGPVDEDLARDIVLRVTVLVFNKKQEQLSLSRDELMKVRTLINRKADSL